MERAIIYFDINENGRVEGVFFTGKDIKLIKENLKLIEELANKEVKNDSER